MRSSVHSIDWSRLMINQPKLAGAPRLGREMQPGFSHRTPDGSVSSRGT